MTEVDAELLGTALEPPFAHQVGAGLHYVAGLLFLLESTRQLMRPDGLALAHFGWLPAGCHRIRRAATILLVVLCPIMFIVSCREWATSGAGSDPLGRLAVMVGLLVIAGMLAWVLHPSGPVVKMIVGRRAGGWIDRLRPIWIGIIVGIPVLLAIGAAKGYAHTAIAFGLAFVRTGLLLLALIVGRGMVMRWIILAHRRIAIEEANRQRAEAIAARAETDSDTPSESGVTVEEPHISIADISAQSRHMIGMIVALVLLVGITSIWSGMVPALSMLNRVELWPEMRFNSEADVAADIVTNSANLERVSTAEEPPADGATDIVPTLVPQTEPTPTAASPPVDRNVLTLGHLLTAIAILIVGLFIARNAPGLLELMVLQRLPMEHSARFAVMAIVRYAITIIAIVMAFNALGIGWSTVQWLAAAVTVGLGFGLQEIFANFVSGLILLFERPIRVGDTVTVGEISGTVTRIRIRATTILDWDRKELIIPNREFVTGQIVNWSLTDAILRIRVPVGVAYGSDTKTARRLLHEVAAADPAVRDDPAPQVVFMSFGDSSLDFELRVFISNIDQLLWTRDRLHDAIDQAFRKAGIEIAFPLTDLHLRSVDPSLRPEIVRNPGSSSPESPPPAST